MTAPVIVEAKPRSLVSSRATIMLMKPSTAPTERSMPPVMMTKVCPIARMAMKAVWRSRLAMLLAVQNVVVSIDSASHMMARRPSRVRPRKHARGQRRPGAFAQLG